jgi:hypothetical protein
MVSDAGVRRDGAAGSAAFKRRWNVNRHIV